MSQSFMLLLLCNLQQCSKNKFIRAPGRLVSCADGQKWHFEHENGVPGARTLKNGSARTEMADLVRGVGDSWLLVRKKARN